MDSLRLRPSSLRSAPGAAAAARRRVKREQVRADLTGFGERKRCRGVRGFFGHLVLLFMALSIVSVSLLAVESLSDISPLFLTGLLEAVVAALFMNIYIVGLNQLFDIEIDKVNKPTLPLASGEYSPAMGVAIVSVFAAMSVRLTGALLFELQSFGLGWVVGSPPLFWALFISFVLGTAYSVNLPYFRWKRFAVVAALCILGVRAVIVQLAFFLHIQTFVFRRPAVFSKPLIFATAFMTFFSVVIALFKDIPDIEGDRIFGIQSFSVRLGQSKVFWTCVGLLEVAYGVAILMGHYKVVGHAILASILWSSARSIDLTSKAAITSFYMLIWRLFYAEYLLIPLLLQKRPYELTNESKQSYSYRYETTLQDK
uniref:Homogentisate phytyltransferase 1, chloroplastic n=1 Tax=Aegilops tauschii TaxID=37682 RepID=M8BJB8_AEGTA